MKKVQIVTNFVERNDSRSGIARNKNIKESHLRIIFCSPNGGSHGWEVSGAQGRANKTQAPTVPNSQPAEEKTKTSNRKLPHQSGQPGACLTKKERPPRPAAPFPATRAT